jgi:hypothetical protein
MPASVAHYIERADPVLPHVGEVHRLDLVLEPRGAPLRHHSASRARIIAGLSGFFTLSQSRDGPDRYGADSRFDTMPSSPILQACRKMVSSAVLIGVLAEYDADPSPADQPPKQLFAVSEGQRSKILTVEFEEVEGVQHGFTDCAVAMQGIEDRYAVRTADHGLSVDREGRGAQRGRRGDAGAEPVQGLLAGLIGSM